MKNTDITGELIQISSRVGDALAGEPCPETEAGLAEAQASLWRLIRQAEASGANVGAMGAGRFLPHNWRRRAARRPLTGPIRLTRCDNQATAVEA